MNPIMQLGHLARRFFGSLSRRQPNDDDVSWVIGQLLADEAALWHQLPVEDRRHSILVARRFATIAVKPTRAEMAGALLHDIGKVASGLGTFGRVLATVVGPRSERFRRYHDHEALGIEMLRRAGAEADTLALIAGTGRGSNALRDADAI